MRSRSGYLAQRTNQRLVILICPNEHECCAESYLCAKGECKEDLPWLYRVRPKETPQHKYWSSVLDQMIECSFWTSSHNRHPKDALEDTPCQTRMPRVRSSGASMIPDAWEQSISLPLGRACNPGFPHIFRMEPVCPQGLKAHRTRTEKAKDPMGAHASTSSHRD